MDRIATSTKHVDLFGAGKHGFGQAPDVPLATHLSPEWCNDIQEEIVRALEDQSVVLASGSYQLAAAINSWNFSGEVRIKNSATFVVQAGGEGSVEATGVWVFNNIPEFKNGASFYTAGTLNLSSAVAFAAAGDASFTKSTAQVSFAGGLLIASGKTILGADATTQVIGFGTIEGAVVQTTAAGKISTRRVEFSAAVAGAANQVVRTSAGNLDWNNGSTLHASSAGLAYARGHSDSAAAAGSHTVATANAVAPVDGTSPLHIEGKAMVQRVTVGNCTISLQREDSPGAGTYTTIGALEIVTTADLATDANGWTTIHISRQYTPGSSSLKYRLKIDANAAGSVAYRSGVVRVEPA